MSLRCHITRLTSTCFGVLRQKRSIRRCLSKSARTALVTCFVFAWLDYCNAVFTGPPRCELNRLQSIQNAAVLLIAGARQFDHVTPLLQTQHWLPIEQRITFKLSVMMYKTVNGIAPSYLYEYAIYLPSSRYSLQLRWTCVCCSRAKSLEQSSSDGAVCTVTVYIQVLFEDISFSLCL